jgi:hypothetical protein
MILLEGGNVFKNEKGEPLTQRINRADVEPTVKWLESLTGLNLLDNMLGSTGRKYTSGDLDLGVDETKVSKQTLIDVLLRKGIKNTDIKKSGDSVHLKTPINGDAKNGYVQTDFMFTSDTAWQQFSLTGGFDSKFKGVHRHILLASIAKANGLKWSNKYGLISRTSNEVITKDPAEVAKILINGTVKDIATVEGIINKIKDLPNYEDLVKDAKDAFEKDNLVLPEMRKNVLPGTGAWYKQWTYKL